MGCKSPSKTSLCILPVQGCQGTEASHQGGVAGHKPAAILSCWEGRTVLGSAPPVAGSSRLSKGKELFSAAPLRSPPLFPVVIPNTSPFLGKGYSGTLWSKDSVNSSRLSGSWRKIWLSDSRSSPCASLEKPCLFPPHCISTNQEAF